MPSPVAQFSSGTMVGGSDAEDRGRDGLVAELTVTTCWQGISYILLEIKTKFFVVVGFDLLKTHYKEKKWQTKQWTLYCHLTTATERPQQLCYVWKPWHFLILFSHLYDTKVVLQRMIHFIINLSIIILINWLIVKAPPLPFLPNKWLKWLMDYQNSCRLVKSINCFSSSHNWQSFL